MRMQARILPSAALVLVLAGLAACSDTSDAVTSPDPASAATFTNVSAALTAACSGCHGGASGRIFLATADSASLVGSGFISPKTPEQSPILVKPRSVAHGGGVVTALSSADSGRIAQWISKQPDVGVTVVVARSTPSPMTVDGVDGDWLFVQPIVVGVGGGWAAATSVQIRAVYDTGYIYMIFRWADRGASRRRQPWVKQSDGSWAVAAAKPAPIDGVEDWGKYMARNGGASFNNEAPQFMYEDKLAVAWNTYGATTSAGFEKDGCAALCHDPAKNGSPGTTYNYSRNDLAAKKYTNSAAEIVDLWHWKSVRQNVQGKMDDQYVKYWVPVNDASAANGGRASDAGAGGYVENPAFNGRPTFKSLMYGLVPPFYAIATTDTVRIADSELLSLSAGSQVANMITSALSGQRADIDGKGVYNANLGYWTYELKRKLKTGDDKDVQFDDLTRAYRFGIAIFDNAQIEHSISGTPLKMIFK